MSIGIERSKIFELAFMWIQMNEKNFLFLGHLELIPRRAHYLNSLIA